MIFDFEPWQLDIDIDLTKQLYRIIRKYWNYILVGWRMGCRYFSW